MSVRASKCGRLVEWSIRVLCQSIDSHEVLAVHEAADHHIHFLQEQPGCHEHSWLCLCLASEIDQHQRQERGGTVPGLRVFRLSRLLANLSPHRRLPRLAGAQTTEMLSQTSPGRTQWAARGIVCDIPIGQLESQCSWYGVTPQPIATSNAAPLRAMLKSAFCPK
jgi:hypothetical protein